MTLRQRRPDRITRPEHEIHHPGRQPDLVDQLEEPHRTPRRQFGRFEDAAIPGRQRRRELPHRHEQRVVPRDDLPADTDRLAHRDRLHARVRRFKRLPARFRRESGVIPEAPRRIRHVVARFAQRLAVIERIATDKFLRVRVDQVRQLEEERRPLRPRRPRPRTLVERRARHVDRRLHVRDSRVRRHAQHGIIRRIVKLPRRPPSPRRTPRQCNFAVSSWLETLPAKSAPSASKPQRRCMPKCE